MQSGNKGDESERQPAYKHKKGGCKVQMDASNFVNGLSVCSQTKLHPGKSHIKKQFSKLSWQNIKLSTFNSACQFVTLLDVGR